jgi:transcriptional regulator with XRE-family HTH domain
MTQRTFVARTGGDLGQAIAEIRRARGLTQRELSAALGIERTRITKLESGARSTIVLEQLMRALRRLGATVTITFDAGNDDDGHA